MRETGSATKNASSPMRGKKTSNANPDAANSLHITTRVRSISWEGGKVCKMSLSSFPEEKLFPTGGRSKAKTKEIAFSVWPLFLGAKNSLHGK